MSNIYIQEPPTEGKVLLETTVGDIDIELWSREAPKACRNFIQLCLEGYYDKTLFHRLVPGFIVQGGDPTGTGSGGASIWGKPFKDEIHSRLRFVRRGLVAMANAGRDDNASQFFFTLGPTPELQNKHTIFGKVGGNTIYNMIKLEDGEMDENERPRYPHKILKTKILNNPFDDIVPRVSIKALSKDEIRKNKNKSSAAATKNYSLLSFGIEAEEEEEEIDSINQQFSSGKGKSSHDLTSDPKLSSQSVEVGGGDPAASEKDSKKLDKKRKHSSDEEEDSENDGDSLSKESKSGGDQLTVSSVKEKLSSKAATSKSKPEMSKKSKSSSSSHKDKGGGDSSEEEYYLGKEEKEAEKLRLESIRKEYRALKRTMKDDQEAGVKAKNKVAEVEALSANKNEALTTYFQEQEVYKEKKRSSGVKKGDDREAQTLALLAKFKNKIVSAKESFPEEEEKPSVAEESDPEKVKKVEVKGRLYEGDEDYDPSDTSWLAKSLHTDGEAAEILAKDANRKADDWYEIYDPKNPLNRRRREESKRAEGEKWKKLRPTD